MEGVNLVDIYSTKGIEYLFHQWHTWMKTSLGNLHPIRHDALGLVLQDGGLPLEGIAWALGGDQWAGLSKTHLLTDAE